MAILIPDKIISVTIGGETIQIKQKIIPDSARATKDVCSYIKKGQPMKPCLKLNNGTGKPKGITIHNTDEIKVSPETTPAEQYTRATYPNGNMNGVVVHFYVCRDDIWQNLDETERGWHAADGSSRRKDHRGGQTGGNIDTIAIECIGDSKESETTVAKLTAYLCKKYGLDPAQDVYTHNYWMYGKDEAAPGVRKNCPIYILPHWSNFLASIQKYCDDVSSNPKVPTTSPYEATAIVNDPNAPLNVRKGPGVDYGVIGGFPNGTKVEITGKCSNGWYQINYGGSTGYVNGALLTNSKATTYKVQVGAFNNKDNAEAQADKLKKDGYDTYIVRQ